MAASDSRDGARGAPARGRSAVSFGVLGDDFSDLETPNTLF